MKTLNEIKKAYQAIGHRNFELSINDIQFKCGRIYFNLIFRTNTIQLLRSIGVNFSISDRKKSRGGNGNSFKTTAYCSIDAIDNLIKVCRFNHLNEIDVCNDHHLSQEGFTIHNKKSIFCPITDRIKSFNKIIISIRRSKPYSDSTVYGRRRSRSKTNLNIDPISTY